MKAVIYARYSSDNQREESIEGQIRECRAFAERKGYSIIGTYIDRAISAKTDNRPEFQQMIKDSSGREFEAVIVWKLDRFARNRYDSARYKAVLRKNGVNVISATETISDGAEGIILESVLEGMAEYYSAELAEKVTRGMTENALKGAFNGGCVTYGYMIDKNKHFCIDPAAAPVVQDIFKRYADGETIRSIADDLNSKGIKNKNGKFTYHFINWLLKNRRYLGEYSYRGTINTTAIPPLVTPELFERCQQRLESNKHKAASFKTVDEKYLLTGKIFCGECGTTLSGISGTSKYNIRYRYYQCLKSKKKACVLKAIKKDLIEKLVVNCVMSIFDDSKLIRRISESCYAMQSGPNPQLAVLKKQLRVNAKEIKNIMTAIKAGIITKTTSAELKKLEAEQEALEAEIAHEQLKRPLISAEMIEQWITKFAKTDLNNPEQTQRLIDTFVNSVYVYDDKVVVLFNYKDGEKCISYEELSEGIKKENTRKSECSSLFEIGDPYGN